VLCDSLERAGRARPDRGLRELSVEDSSVLIPSSMNRLRSRASVSGTDSTHLASSLTQIEKRTWLPGITTEPFGAVEDLLPPVAGDAQIGVFGVGLIDLHSGEEPGELARGHLGEVAW
jgi:hypothetical protein